MVDKIKIKNLLRHDRMQNGIVFSKIRKNLLKITMEHIKGYPTIQIKNPNSLLWNNLYKKYFYINNVKDNDEIKLAEKKAYAQVKIQFLLAQKKWHNFYIMDESLVEFLEKNDISNIEINYLIDIIQRYLETDKFKNGVAFHFAGRKDSAFIDIMITKGSEENQNFLTLIMTTNGRIYCSYFSNNEIINDNSEFIIDRKKEHCIIFNLFLYIDAFPQCLHDGPPNLTIKKPYLNLMNSAKVQAHPIIIQQHKKSLTSPHFRRGHFKILKSERFSNKRFQTIYVSPTIVNGKSETVEKARVKL